MGDPQGFARHALRWDAAYCALGGTLTVVFAAPLGGHLRLPDWLVALGGFGVIAWAGLVWGFARSDEWWGPTALVAAANAAAGVLLGVWAFATTGSGGAVLGLAAVQVLAFAVSLGLTLVRGWGDRVV